MRFKSLKVTILTFAFFTLIVSGCNKNTETISVYNWGDYLDGDLLSKFTKETGIVINYENYGSNEEMYTKVKSSGASYDVIIPSDYTIEKMIKEDLLDELNFDNIPNYKNIAERFKKLPYDNNSKYSVPYMWGTVGILYNTKMVTESVDSFDMLWNENYKGQIFMYDSIRDSLAVSLKRLGFSLNSKNLDEITLAKEELIKQLPLVQAYVTDTVKDKMINNEGALAIVYSGDAMYCMELNEDLAYVVPKEGSNIWYDAMVIPKNAKNKEGAEKFINFMNDAEISKQNSEYIGYSSTNRAGVDLLPKEITDNEIYWPSEEIIKDCEVFIDLEDFLSEYDKAWTEVLSQHK